MSRPAWEVRRIRWWHKPVPLVQKRADGWTKVGWVWNQWAYLVNNVSLGWMAPVDDQTPEKIDTWKCPHCQASIWGSQREKIIKALKEPTP